MTWLITGLIVLIGIHTLPWFDDTRRRLIENLGEAVYKCLFGLVAMAGLVLIIIGKYQVEMAAVWQPPAWCRQLPFYFMPPAFILITAAYLPGNLKRWIRHPMLWGVTLWAASHLPASGDPASIILFAGLGLYSLAAMAAANRRGAVKSTLRRPWQYDCLVIAAGFMLFGLTLPVHPDSPFLKWWQ